MLEASGNVLLAIAAQPVFDVLQTRLARSTLGSKFHRTINAHHRAIVAAIEAGDEDAAGGEMHVHVEYPAARSTRRRGAGMRGRA